MVQLKTTFVRQLSEEIQQTIENELVKLGLPREDIERALDSRLSDLEDTIPETIKEVVNRLK